MTHPTPLLARFEAAGAAMIRFGPEGAPIDLAGALGPVDEEYETLLQGAALLDQPARATLTLTGADRLEFLQRLVTQQLADLAPGSVVPAFFLSRKGRIDADLRVVHLADRTILETDAHAVEALRASLDQYLFSEDVVFGTLPESTHVIELHGEVAVATLASIEPSLPEVGSAIEGASGVIARTDGLGGPGYVVVLPTDGVNAFVDAWLTAGGTAVGWYAANIARIEAGRPSYFIDFGPDSLPGETGVLRDRVCFTKGCYVGQEVVARMDALGHPARMLVALRFDLPEGAEPFQPITGAPVRASDNEDAKVIGAVTSSTLSPRLGGVPVCFAMVKWAHVSGGTELWVEAEGSLRRALVQDGLGVPSDA